MARLGRDPALAAVLMVDLDRFKEVAERFGDDAVDRLLVAVAGRLRSILRRSTPTSCAPSTRGDRPDRPPRGWVLAESCRQAARWRANGPRTLAPTVHVNPSPRQFAEPHLVDLVAGALADTGTDPDRLCLEVTERALAAAQRYLFARPETASRVGELLGHDRRWQ